MEPKTLPTISMESRSTPKLPLFTPPPVCGDSQPVDGAPC